MRCCQSSVVCVLSCPALFGYIKDCYPPITYDRETPKTAYGLFNKAFSTLILHCESLVKPDSTILSPKGDLRWHKLLVKLVLNVLSKKPQEHSDRCLLQSTKLPYTPEEAFVL